MRRKDKDPLIETALQAKDIEQLNSKLDALVVEIANGFAGVHSRQDKTNGNVIHAQEDITTLKAKFEYNRIIWYLFTVSITVVVALSSYILFRQH